MEIFGQLATVSVYGLMAGLLATAALTVTTRNLFHSAIFLAFTLLGVAILYFFLHADFIAAIQILLYVGAIMVLVIFAIMLTARIQDPKVPQSNRQQIPTLVLMSAVATYLITAILKTPWNLAPTPKSTDAVALGKALMGEFVFPFEVVSIVLLVALIGAIVVARSDQ
jgi:NADH:ubiquinone oxidoreductase subunit 6 (subunit J)